MPALRHMSECCWILIRTVPWLIFPLIHKTVKIREGFLFPWCKRFSPALVHLFPLHSSRSNVNTQHSEARPPEAFFIRLWANLRGNGLIDNESSAHPDSALLILTRMSCLKKLCVRQQQCVNQDYPVEFSRHCGKVYTVEHVRGRVGEHTLLSFYFPFSILFPSWDDALCIAIQFSEVSVFLWQLRQNHLLVA